MAVQEPGLRLALLGEKGPSAACGSRGWHACVRIGAATLHIADAAPRAEAHRRGLAVYVWTVDVRCDGQA